MDRLGDMVTGRAEAANSDELNFIKSTCAVKSTKLQRIVDHAMGGLCEGDACSPNRG
jgi:hypothetical protein